MRVRSFAPFVLFVAAGCAPTASVGSDGGADAQPTNECPTPSGPGTTHAGVTSAETWTAAASPHVVPAAMNVSAPLTIEACAVVKIAAGVIITIRQGGVITANGTATRPVVFDQRDAGKPWGQIRTVGGTMSLTYTQVLNGGDLGNAMPDTAAALDVRGVELHVDNVLVKDSAAQGILMTGGGTFSSGSRALTITGSKHFPLHVAANAAGGIPSGAYVGNAKDEITLEGNGASAVDRDVTFHDRQVPYRVGDALLEGRLLIAPPANQATLVTLTIEPNVKLRFKKGGSVFVQYAQSPMPSASALVAVGTQDKPIVFTSAEDVPAPGDWAGIHFNGQPDASDRIEFARIEYAGGAFPAANLVGAACKYDPNQVNLAAVRIFEAPASAFIKNTTIVSSPNHGVDRGWSGSTAVSFLGNGNDLTGVMKCKETQPGPSCQSPSCP